MLCFFLILFLILLFEKKIDIVLLDTNKNTLDVKWKSNKGEKTEELGESSYIINR